MKKLLIILVIAGGAVFVILSRGDKPAPAGQESGKNYVAHSAEECSRTQVLCVEGFERFDDDAGCGCQPVANGQGTGVDREGDEDQAVREVKEFVFEGRNFEFSKNEFTVSRGDTVRIVFRAIEGFHDWRIEGYGVGTRRVGQGQEASIEFLADNTGEFEFFCSVGNHRFVGMTGALTVTD